jgi:methylthioribose-1-phosphate isomerase
MGAAKENRDRAYFQEVSNIRNREIKNTELAKAAFWRDLITEGHVLTFKMANGGILTAGPYLTATGPVTYAAIQQGKHHKQERFGSAWGIALEIIKWCGRVRPIIIDGCKQ